MFLTSFSKLFNSWHLSDAFQSIADFLSMGLLALGVMSTILAFLTGFSILLLPLLLFWQLQFLKVLLPELCFVWMSFSFFTFLFIRYLYIDTAFIESAFCETSFSLSSGLPFCEIYFGFSSLPFVRLLLLLTSCNVIDNERR